MKKFINRVTVKTIILVIVCVFPLNIYALINAWNLTEEMIIQSRQTLQNIADIYTNNLDYTMENADSFLFDLISNDENLIAMRRTSNEAAYIISRQKLYLRLQDLIDLRLNSDGFFVYMSTNDDLLLVSNTAYKTDLAILHVFLKDVEDLPLSRKWTIVEIGDKQWLLRILKEQEIYYGAFINLDSYNKEIIEKLSFETGTAWFSAENTKERKGQILVGSQCQKGNAILNLSANTSEIIRNLSYAKRGAVLLAILFLLMIPALYIYLRKMLLNPIKELNKAHQQYQNDADYRIQGHANTTELENAYLSFNEMAENIQKLKLDNMEKELEKTRMEISNLQLQIRPHFLLNTFNLICVLSEHQNHKAVRELILYLSDYFRYIYRSGKEKELFDKELHLIQGYLQAASIRFPGLIHVLYQIEPQISLVRVPPLLIHNFVENIINHAMIQDKPLNIMVCASYDDKKAIFQISDDGRGIDPDVVRQINAGEYCNNDERIHVGLHNSIRRLKYFYGEHASLQVESEIGEGTIFTITIPYDLGSDIE